MVGLGNMSALESVEVFSDRCLRNWLHWDFVFVEFMSNLKLAKNVFSHRRFLHSYSHMIFPSSLACASKYAS
jgi:hypothetical protein